MWRPYNANEDKIEIIRNLSVALQSRILHLETKSYVMCERQAMGRILRDRDGRRLRKKNAAIMILLII